MTFRPKAFAQAPPLIGCIFRREKRAN
eukprot:COSAG03_NODE_25360_length_266_cov_0.616766_1_plen_26_part_10